MLYRNKNDDNYICRVISGRDAVTVTKPYWHYGDTFNKEFTIDFSMWIPITFNDYISKL